MDTGKVLQDFNKRPVLFVVVGVQIRLAFSGDKIVKPLLFVFGGGEKSAQLEKVETRSGRYVNVILYQGEKGDRQRNMRPAIIVWIVGTSYFRYAKIGCELHAIKKGVH